MSPSNRLIHDAKHRTLLKQLATTVFIGIPATVGLITAMAGYCAFHVLAFHVFRRKRLRFARHKSEPVMGQSGTGADSLRQNPRRRS